MSLSVPSPFHRRMPVSIATMEILENLPEHRVLVCRPCGIAVAPHWLHGRICKLHVGQCTGLPANKAAQLLVDEDLPAMLDRPLLDPRREYVSLPALDCEALRGRHTHRRVGYNYCHFVCKGTGVMRKHYNAEHALVRRTRGGVQRHQGSSAKLTQDSEHFGS